MPWTLFSPFFPKPFYRPSEPVFKFNRRTPAQFLMRLLSRDFLSAKVSGALGNKFDFHVISDSRPDALGDLEDRDFPRAFEVIGLVSGGLLHGKDVGLGKVPDIDEVPLLIACSRYGERLASQGFFDERRNQ